jgi:photosystem II stability/assembly factor-like uncharacterized protein
MSPRRVTTVAALVPLLCLPISSFAQQAPAPGVAALAQWHWRAIGPANMGGRVTAVTGMPGVADTFYVAGADGGLWKTVNAGVTFTALFTDQDVYSIGAVTVAPSDHNVLWVGTGEGDPRNSASFGDGVYRSDDAGRTWRHLGLDDSERIKRIVVDPRNPDVAYVCALGHAWGPNAERGVFRTSDGGVTWNKVLYRNEDTGCSDIAMDAANPRILYAGMWTFRRRPWLFTDGGGETALYRSMDGGTSWTKLTNGLPTSPMARIGVATSDSHPETVYMITETKADGNLFRSDDRGDSWRKVYDDPGINFRPFYYSDIRVDPTNPEIVYALGGSLSRSKDGGRTFQTISRGVHGDHQALWIDPLDPNRILSGSDGGYQLTSDGADTWKIMNNVELSQFYHIAYDMREPYYVCGGLQDNGAWCGPTATPFREGIRKDDWYTISGGDGFYAVPTMDRPNIIFSNLQGGVIFETDLRSWSTRNVHPYPNRIGSAGDAMIGHKYRFNWDSPIVLSPNDPKVVYFGGNVLFRTRNDGQTWEVISPDLTTNDTTKQQSSGGPIYVDNTAAEFHTTIMTIAESPVRAGVIWVGTDDGNIQVTQDDGNTWTNVVKNVKGLPPNSWVSRIEASHYDAGTAYVAIDRHQENDFAPYLYQTTDYGKTWTALRGNLPPVGYTHVIREDPIVRDLLYAGTELGVFASWNGGREWSSLRMGLPPVAVRDIRVHPRDDDLIIATHGRGAWVLDHITALQQLATVGGQVRLFDVRPAIRWEMAGRDANLGSETYQAENPPFGALIDFYLPAVPQGAVQLTIAGADGKTVRELRVRAPVAGVNRMVWDLSYEGPQPVPGQRGSDEGGGRRFNTGPLASPGEYRVTLTAGGATASTTLQVRPDPRREVPAADFAAQLAATLELRDFVSTVNRAVGRSEDVIGQLAELQQRLARERAPDSVRAAVRAAHERLVRFRGELTRPTPTFGYRQYPRLREELTSLSSAINGVAARPTDAQQLRLGELRTEVQTMERDLAAALADVEAINRMLADRPVVITGGRS